MLQLNFHFFHKISHYKIINLDLGSIKMIKISFSHIFLLYLFIQLNMKVCHYIFSLFFTSLFPCLLTHQFFDWIFLKKKTHSFYSYLPHWLAHFRIIHQSKKMLDITTILLYMLSLSLPLKFFFYVKYFHKYTN